MRKTSFNPFWAVGLVLVLVLSGCGNMADRLQVTESITPNMPYQQSYMNTNQWNVAPGELIEVYGSGFPTNVDVELRMLTGDGAPGEAVLDTFSIGESASFSTQFRLPAELATNEGGEVTIAAIDANTGDILGSMVMSTGDADSASMDGTSMDGATDDAMAPEATEEATDGEATEEAAEEATEESAATPEATEETTEEATEEATGEEAAPDATPAPTPAPTEEPAEESGG